MTNSKKAAEKELLLKIHLFLIQKLSAGYKQPEKDEEAVPVYVSDTNTGGFFFKGPVAEGFAYYFAQQPESREHTAIGGAELAEQFIKTPPECYIFQTSTSSYEADYQKVVYWGNQNEKQKLILTALLLTQFSVEDLKKLNIPTNKENLFLFFRYDKKSLLENSSGSSLIKEILEIDNLTRIISQIEKKYLWLDNIVRLIDIFYDPQYVDPKNKTTITSLVIEKAAGFFDKPTNQEIFIQYIKNKSTYAPEDERFYRELFSKLNYPVFQHKPKVFEGSAKQMTSVELNVEQGLLNYALKTNPKEQKEAQLYLTNHLCEQAKVLAQKDGFCGISFVSHIMSFNKKKQILLEVQEGVSTQLASDLFSRYLDLCLQEYTTIINRHIAQDPILSQSDSPVHHCFYMEKTSSYIKDKLDAASQMIFEKMKLEYDLKTLNPTLKEISPSAQKKGYKI